MTHKDRASFRRPPTPNSHDLPTGSVKGPTPSPYSVQAELSREAQRRSYLSKTSNRTFLTFLSSHGPGGVSLRELIMLVMLRQAGRESNNHWLMSGEVGTFEKATTMSEIVPERQDSVFGFFMRDGVVDHSAIESFQELLEDLNYIDVNYPEGTYPDKTSQYWLVDERVWIVRKDQSSEPWEPIDDPTVLRELLDMFMEMPDKDVSLAAQRQREVYYYHAHLLIPRIIQSGERLEEEPSLFGKAILVTLQLLTYRYQPGDSLLLDFVRRYFVYYRPDINMMLLWAELKEKTLREDYDGLCAIRNDALYHVDLNVLQSQAVPRLNGFLGFLLVDLMKSAKALHFEDIVADALKAGTRWVDSAQRIATSIEKTALCEMLATFNMHARKEIIQKEYYLFYGYHLSRAGFLEQGDHFLARGLEDRDSFPLWSYEMERISNALRLGRQDEAAKMLKSLRKLALRYRDKKPRHWYVEDWKRSGECAEVFVLLNLYEADYSASAGMLDSACAKLKSGISITSSVFDAYIQILRVTLKMRLVEILMRQGRLENALSVALNLASEILDGKTRSILTPDTVYGIVQQSLDLSNSLLSAQKAVASMTLLKSVMGTGVLLPVELSLEIKSYVEQRMAKARQFSETIELSEHDQNPNTLDTGIEDPMTTVQIDPGNGSMVRKREETVFLANASFPPRLPNPTNLQTLAGKRRQRFKVSSPKAFQSKMYASFLRKLERVPRPPSTEPDKYESASEEKAMQQEEIPSWHEGKPSVIILRMPYKRSLMTPRVITELSLSKRFGNGELGTQVSEM